MATEDESKEGQKPKSKMLIIVLALVVVLGAGGAAAYFMFLKAPGKSEPVKTEETPIPYSFTTFIVNLADPGSKRFLKVSLDMKLSSKEAEEECKSKESELKDLVLTVLSSQESGDIVTGEDKLRLKKKLLKSLNDALTKGKVLEVFFTDFLIQ